MLALGLLACSPWLFGEPRVPLAESPHPVQGQEGEAARAPAPARAAHRLQLGRQPQERSPRRAPGRALDSLLPFTLRC